MSAAEQPLSDAPRDQWRNFRARTGALEQELRVGAAAGVRSCPVPELRAGDDALETWWRRYLAGAALDPLPEKSPRTVRTVDLFCGAGGLSLGFARACNELGLEHESIAAADIDAVGLDVFARNHSPAIAYPGSVASIVDYQIREARDGPRFLFDPAVLREEWRQLAGKVDAVLAGPPCQGHSDLNNHSRRFDARNRLYITVPAFAVAVGAPMVVIENVPNVINDHHGVVETTMSLLTQAGYSVTSGVLAADKLGWPQARRRFFLLAHREHIPLDLESVAEGLAADARPVLWALADLPADDEAPHMRQTPAISEETRRRIDWLFDNDEYDLALAERPDCHKAGTSYRGVYGRMRPDKPAPTLTTGFMTTGQGRFVHPTERRVLTPREAARLQGFPDTYVFSDPESKPPARRDLGKWIGDAVPMPLGFAAGLALLGARHAGDAVPDSGRIRLGSDSEARQTDI